MAGRRRNEVLDFWRGFALVSIYVNHIPGNVLERLTHRNFGFSDGAEAFVFIAGVGIALAYYPRVPGGALMDVAWRCVQRAFHLYKVHLVLTCAAVAMVALVSVATDFVDIIEADGRGAVFNDTARTVVGMLFLGHQLGYFDILPMYVALMLWAPVAFALVRIHPGLALAASLAIYWAARLWGLNVPSWPEPGGWYFNPFAWQFLFTLGILTGIAHSGGLVRFSSRAFALSAAIVLGTALAATDVLGFAPGTWERALQALDIEKSNLGVARLIHFLTLAYLVSQLPLVAALARTWAGEELQRLGRQALPVFAVGSLLSVLGQVIMTLSQVRTSNSPALIGMVFTIFGAIGLLLLARYLEWSSTTPGRRPVAPRLSRSVSSSGASRS